MKAFRTVVVGVILGALFSPAMAMAKTEPQAVPPVTAQQVVTAGVALANAAATGANAQTTQSSEAAQYAQREQQAQDVQNFKGGAVYVYFGSGVVLALIIIILILL